MGRKSFKQLFYLVLLLAFLSVISVGCGGKGVYFVGHKGTRVFHRPGCKYAPAKENSVTFMGAGKAQAAGYRPCAICDPLGTKNKSE